MEITVPELSNDLEWMLQSGQATTNMLAEALLKEYYAPVYRLVNSLLDDPEAAQQVGLKVFSTAMMYAYRYRSEVGVEVWIYRITLEACRRAGWGLKTGQFVKSTLRLRSRSSKFLGTTPITPLDSELWLAADGMKGDLRLIMLLYYVHGWQVERIARLLKFREGVVHANLRTARLIIEKQLGKKSFQVGELGSGGVEDNLSRSLQSRWPDVQFSEHEFNKALDDLGGQTARRGRARQQTTWLKEVALTMVGIVVAVLLIYGVDRSLPEADATQTPAVPVAVAQAATPEPKEAMPSPFITSTIAPTLSPLNYFYIIQPGDTLKIISKELNVPADELRKVNRLPYRARLKPGQALYIPPAQKPGEAPLPEDNPSPTIVPTAALSTPLTPPFELVSVQAKMRWFDWRHRTVWLDAQSLNLGPAGYIGPPQVRRIQTWLGQNQFLMLTGTLNGGINNVWLRTDGTLYQASPLIGVPSFFGVTQNEFIQNPTVHDFFTSISDLTFSQNIVKAVQLGVEGSDQVAGRQAVIVVRKDRQGQVRARFWVDTQTGFLLRMQRMDDADPQIVRTDFVVTSIAFDVNFPQELFNPQLPWRGGFAQDSTGNPEALDSATLVPGRERLPTNYSMAGNDFSKSNLTFQYPQSIAEEDPQALVQVFADKVHIGDINLGNPWTMICKRSPDGNKIAFVSQPTLSLEQDAFLNWFSLPKKGKGQMSLGGMYVTSFAFAPDSRRLAFFGFDGQFSEGAVYILDTETGKYNQLMWLLNARSLVWSPDGQFLAFVGAEHSLSSEETIVMNATTGEVIYRGPAANDIQPVASDAPITHWGVQFPTKMVGLEACAAAPVK